MVEENINQTFRLKNIDGTRNCLIEEINWNELISKKYKKVFYNSKLYWTLSYLRFYNWLLVGILIGITSSVIGLKFEK